MNENSDWYKLGQLYGCDIKIDLNSRPMNASNKKLTLQRATSFFEKAFKREDFFDQLKEIFGSETTNEKA